MTVWEIIQNKLMASNSLKGGQARARALAASGAHVLIGTGRTVHRTLKWSGEPYCGAKVTTGTSVTDSAVTCKNCAK